MTANKLDVQRYDNMGCPEEICRVDTMYESDDGDYVLYEDYEALQAECEKLVEALEAALMVMTSKEVRLEKQADAITMARAALAAYRNQGGEV